MPKGKSSQILIIEDNFFMAQLLAERLGHQDLPATIASDGETGLAELQKEAPALVLLDLPLAGKLDGWKTLEGIRKASAEVPILLLFNSDQKEDDERARKLGATDILIKGDTSSGDIVARAVQLVTGKAPEGSGATVPDTPPKDGKTTLLERASGLQAGGQDLSVRAAKLLAEMTETLKQPEAQISIIKLVDDMMTYGFLVRASDVHMEPVENEFIARMRIDGILNDVFRFPKSLHSGIITRIKVLAGMRTDEHQAAQDGRFRMRVTDPDKQFDVRVSVVPTYYGENAVLRLLAEQTAISSLDDLAFSDSDRKKIRKAVQTPYGMILATGPTGSGKTTTLYTILKELNTREVQIITLEDPIEYSLEGVDQIQVNQRTGLTFAVGLRSILRQDPNIIMVGEIRDEETASIAVNAALTGHKLLATLHTNDAATTLPRLLDMSVEPFLVASTVNVALGQRLVRMICPHCKEPRRITEGEFSALKDTIPAELLDDHRDFFQGKGCAVCHDTGYLGRMGIYEVLEVNDFIREAVMRHADAGEVKKIAVKNGMTTLLEDGFTKAVAGLTTIEEILRVIHE
ncbi:MAG TPA: ATPase, T2SS/T4P/T4SS family [Candidatus Paceibacterota bacterium]|nr:ATPase, T2SS/T4P/T4SS family [Candidatus Paceibacterota bacterium]